MSGNINLHRCRIELMYQKKSVQIIFFTCIYLSFIPAYSGADETSPLPHAEEFTNRIGWTAEDVFNLPTIPISIFPFRGDSPKEDNVVFYYADYLYMFWFHDRIWQVRADERWEGDVDGVHMGMSLDEISGIWGSPINDWDEQPTWTLPDRGYPMRIRLYFTDDGRLNDIYVYRSDW